MKPKQIIILAFIFIFVITLGFLKNAHRAKLIEDTSDTRLNFKFEKDNIDCITLKKADQVQVSLEKENGKWRVPGKWNALADSTRVQSLLDMMSNLTGELRGSSKEIFSDFGITDAESFRIVFSKQAQALVDLVLSAKIPENGGTFVRLENSNSVYLTDSSLFALFGILGDPKSQDLKQDYWIDLTLQTLDMASIRSILYRKYEQGKEKLVFELIQSDDHRWTMKTSADTSEIQADRILDYFHKFQRENALQVLDPKGAYGLEAPDSELLIQLADKSERKLIFKETSKDVKEGGYYVRVSGREEVFLISAYTFNALAPNPDSFTEKPKQ